MTSSKISCLIVFLVYWMKKKGHNYSKHYRYYDSSWIWAKKQFEIEKWAILSFIKWGASSRWSSSLSCPIRNSDHREAAPHFRFLSKNLDQTNMELNLIVLQAYSVDQLGILTMKFVQYQDIVSTNMASISKNQTFIWIPCLYREHNFIFM